MTERSVSGDAVRTKYAEARKKIEDLGLTPDVVDILAEGVREFDEQRSPQQRTVAALEKLVLNTTPERGSSQSSWAWEDRRLRRREIAALELLAVVPVATDEELRAIQAGAIYKKIIDRLSSDQPGSARFDVPD